MSEGCPHCPCAYPADPDTGLCSMCGRFPCTEWDATNGLRCAIDDCTHNATDEMRCPCHNGTLEP